MYLLCILQYYIITLVSNQITVMEEISAQPHQFMLSFFKFFHQRDYYYFVKNILTPLDFLSQFFCFSIADKLNELN